MGFTDEEFEMFQAELKENIPQNGRIKEYLDDFMDEVVRLRKERINNE